MQLLQYDGLVQADGFHKSGQDLQRRFADEQFIYHLAPPFLKGII